MDGHAVWPAIDAGILAHFEKLFVTPVRLDAAFDCEDDCNDLLLSAFPDILDVDLEAGESKVAEEVSAFHCS